MDKEQSDANGGQAKSLILTEEIPKYGRVSMLFYIPESVKDRDTMVELIRENGGNIVKFHECFCYQIGTPGNTKESDYYEGTVYSFQWLVESIEANQLQDKAKYILCSYQGGIKFPFDKKKIQYTIREIIIIYNWISGRKSQASRKTWESLGNDGILYCRSKESLKNFWKNWRKHSLEACIEEMLTKNTKYCHNYPLPVLPHQGLPETDRKKLKRSKEDVEKIDEDSKEKNSDPDESDPILHAIQKKRKLKKKNSEVVKTGDLDRVNTSENKTQKVEEIKHVEGVIDDESDEPDQLDEEKEQSEQMDEKEEPEKDPNVDEKEKHPEDDTTKEEKKDADPDPEKQEDIALDNNSANGIKEDSHVSSDLGFPAFEDGSDDGGDI